MRAVAFRKMRRRREAASQRDIDDTQIGLHQQVARPSQPQLHVIPLGAAVQIAPEQAFQLPCGHADFLGQFSRRDGFLDGVFHSLDHPAQTRVPHADSRGDRQALNIAVRADVGVNQLVGDSVGQVLAVIVGDHRQNQVQRRRSARRGQPVSVNHKDRFRQVGFGELLQKAIAVFPVDRRAAIVQKPGSGQRMGAGAQPADHRPLARHLAQPVLDRRCCRLTHVNATADHDHIVAPHLLERGIDANRHAAGTADILTPFADNRPAIQGLAAHAVGDAQGLDGGGKGQHREFVEQQKDEAALARRLGGNTGRCGRRNGRGRPTVLVRPALTGIFLRAICHHPNILSKVSALMPTNRPHVTVSQKE